MKKIAFAIVILFVSIFSVAQENVTTFGFMIKPIVPSNLFRAGDVTIKSNRNKVDITLAQKVGYSFGMIVRHGITENWTFETGLIYVQRKFDLTLSNAASQYTQSLNYGIVGYEAPITGLLTIQLGDNVFMNTAFGAVLDMYPSSIEATNYVNKQTEYFNIVALRNSWIQFSLNANIGWEYRTKESGTFYVGGAYHRPFSAIYKARIRHNGISYVDNIYTSISGNYLTIDFRYFFHEEPQQRKTREQRKKEQKEKKKKEDVFYRPGIDGRKSQ